MSIVEVSNKVSSVINMLHCNERIESEGGYWADVFLESPIGSGLYKLDRVERSQSTLEMAQIYCDAALLKLGKIASDFECESRFFDENLKIEIKEKS